MNRYNQHAYGQIAGLLSKISHERYSVASLRQSLAAAHILSKGGEVNTSRLERFMSDRRIKLPKYSSAADFWGAVAESDSF